MNQTKRFLATGGGGLVVVGLLLLAALLLGGCGEPEPIAAVPPTATVYAPLPTNTPHVTPPPTPAALHFPLAAPARVEAERPDSQNCVDCHTAEETLKATAREEEQAESLSEGEG